MISAIDYLNAAIEKDPKNTTAWLWLGIRQYALGFFDEAIKSLRTCVSLDPGYLNCRQHLAHTYLSNAGDADTALKLNEVRMEHVFDSISERLYHLRSTWRPYLAVRIADNRLGPCGSARYRVDPCHRESGRRQQCRVSLA